VGGVGAQDFLECGSQKARTRKSPKYPRKSQFCVPSQEFTAFFRRETLLVPLTADLLLLRTNNTTHRAPRLPRNTKQRPQQQPNRSHYFVRMVAMGENLPLSSSTEVVGEMEGKHQPSPRTSEPQAEHADTRGSSDAAKSASKPSSPPSPWEVGIAVSPRQPRSSVVAKCTGCMLGKMIQLSSQQELSKEQQQNTKRKDDKRHADLLDRSGLATKVETEEVEEEPAPEHGEKTDGGGLSSAESDAEGNTSSSRSDSISKCGCASRVGPPGSELTRGNSVQLHATTTEVREKLARLAESVIGERALFAGPFGEVPIVYADFTGRYCCVSE
jgi:hypothetical protein